MGVDLVAILDHRWGVAECSKLPTILNGPDNPMVELQDLLCRKGWIAPVRAKWEFDDDDPQHNLDDKWQASRRLSIRGPNRLISLHFLPQTLAILIHKGFHRPDVIRGHRVIGSILLSRQQAIPTQDAPH